ncbi:UDP-N-acetylenolpyruvoylglucosamine reductase [Nautilia profundicola AmH]|uniref:UDP-N-acetylenolpyruvoylglucosamine reductase n=1 Tax=Nautilia profundicola (strain ATCC BAA-1463 / DSM 18972 / AmH) TaxID=598659 RepID=B9L7T7_NAUPA|nr:UDP-N-acetylmuramate dehydrogenase [Nautilia profundicola]ACM93366.1 UDP-N-acetylenolpyruvoylglucosamine reductase [Nautilia profundicola AmH]
MGYKTIDLSKLSSIKIGPKTSVKLINENNYDGEFLIGRATNTLISPNADNLGVLDDKYKFIEIKNGYLYVGAKTNNQVFYNFCKKNNIGGFEFLSKLPGTIGGSVKMNAGVKEYEISNRLLALKTLNGLKEKKEFEFNYRYSDINEPIFEAVFELKEGFDFELDLKLKKLRQNQPKDPSLGSVFKNPQNDYAGRLIEAVGMKGMIKGGMKVSEIHANFFVNIGEGTFDDMICLIKEAKKRVYENFGINLQEEIKIIY